MPKPIIVIGGGVGGYSTAVRLSRAGKDVVVVEKRFLGGECANFGCIPTKVLYRYAYAARALRELGLDIDLPALRVKSFAEARRRAEQVRKGIEYLLDQAGVGVVHGVARIKTPNTVVIETHDGKRREVEFEKLIIATGTEPRSLPNLRIDERNVLSNRGLLSLEEPPSSVLIVGGGAIGIEMTSILKEMGVDVTVVEIMDRILPDMDPDVSRVLAQILKYRGIEILTRTSVSVVKEESDGRLRVLLSGGQCRVVDKILLCVGRVPNTQGLNLDIAGVRVDERGYIVTRIGNRTTNPNIYAVGDVTGPPLLAHKAILESKIVTDSIMARGERELDRSVIPLAIFSLPEACSIGMREDEAREKCYGATAVVRIPVGAYPRALVEGYRRGFVKVVMCRGRIVGLHAVGPLASEICALGMELLLSTLSPEDLSNRPEPHLTAAEALRELADAILGEPLHMA